MRQLIESSGLIAVWILRCEGLAAGVGSGDDDGTTGIVDCVVIATNAVAGGFESAEECFGFGEHSRVITFSASAVARSAVMKFRVASGIPRRGHSARQAVGSGGLRNRTGVFGLWISLLDSLCRAATLKGT